MFDTQVLGGLFLFYASSLLSYPVTSRYLSPIYLICCYGFGLLAILLALASCFFEIFFNGLTLSWISSNLTSSLATIPLSLNFSVTTLSFSFSFLVLLIGTATNFYILTYFKGEASENNFIFWLNAFILSMLILVLAGNLFTLFLGWELIGLTSFFLINFWSNRRATLKSSYKAFIFNLFSDICLLGSFITLYLIVGSDDCQVITYCCLYGDLAQHTLFQLSVLLLLLCCSIKSVQILGHLWLPDSMEAPVPASSLIHSATLVSAGIFLICKFSLLLEVSQWYTPAILLGALSACYGGIVAASQTDMKKLLAYSTMSHCGFLWVLACLGQVYVTIIYLFLHGIFKAATFYCAGAFIRNYGTQDTRWMGNGLRLYTVNSISLLLCSANLCGLPFTIGYLYKFFFFKVLYSSFASPLALGALFVAAQTSIIYFFRLNFYTLFDFYKNIKVTTLTYIKSTKLTLVDQAQFYRTNHIISYLFLILGSVIFSLTFSLFSALLPIENILWVEDNATLLLANIESLFSSYYIFFYNLYLMIVIYLFVMYNKQSNILLYAQTGFLYFFFLLFFFKFLCELTSWVNLLL